MRRAALLGAAIVALAGTALAMRPAPQDASHNAWQEIAWPFPRDAWPAGRAFRCEGPGCGGAAEVYVRPKIGFCNCAAGVSGDAEVDGVSDLDMVGSDFVPRAPGEPVEIGGMPGRVRRYTLTTPDGHTHPAAGYALSARCDLIAVASLGPAAGSPAARQGLTALLETAPVLAWLRSKLGKS